MVERLVDSGRIPEPILRAAIRAICALRLREQARAGDAASARLIDELRGAPIAIATDAANAQHYEVPAAFFEAVLGPALKYSGCYWPAGTTTLAAAELAMLELVAERAELADGQRVLDLGCGWGSFALWAAARYPRSHVVAISSSRSQRSFIVERARARGLRNVDPRTADVRTLDLDGDGRFDRVVSIEMFEHVRNHGALLARIARWLAPGGALFVHLFAHHRFCYPFDDRGASDWMARRFFTGGLMPSVDLLRRLDDDLAIEAEWRLDGTHYARTAEAWLANLVARRAAVVDLIGARDYQRWRVFFLACAEMFGYRRGGEWLVAHYRLRTASARARDAERGRTR